MKIIKKIAILLFALVMTMSFTGCSSKKTNTTTNDTTNNTTNNSTNNDGLNISGRVTKVDGKKVTISVMPGGGMRGGFGGGRGGNQSGNAPSGMPSGTPNNNDKQGNGGQGGQQPPQGDNNNSGTAQKAQTKVITISDEKIISVQNGDATTSGSLKDIKEGSFLHITYKKDSNGKKVLSSIVVSTMQRQNFNNNQPNNSSNNQ